MRALTSDDHAKITMLASKARKPNPVRIASQINRNRSTVYWFMLTHGLIETKPRRFTERCRSDGKLFFSAEEDAIILRMRAETDHRGRATPFQKIADEIAARLNRKRSAHSVHMRTVILAARGDDE